MGKDGSLRQYFSDLNTHVNIERIPFQNDSIRYIQTGQDRDSIPTLLFIHGAPGNLDNFKTYLADIDLKSEFRLVSMDRLGYGDSDFGNSETDLAVQAKAAVEVLNSFSSSEVYLISHSYGCPIAAKLVIDNPGLIDGLIMCAPLNDPEAEPVEWYSYIANTSYMRLLLPEFVNVASDEKMNHKASLRKIENDWQRISSPVLHIHGKKDGLAPFQANIDFSKKKIPSEFLYLDEQKDMGHLLIWMDAGYIKNRILSFIEECRNREGISL